MATMQLAKHPDGWHIENVGPYLVDGATFTFYGPYDTRAAAESDMRGVQRFERTWREETATKKPAAATTG